MSDDNDEITADRAIATDPVSADSAEDEATMVVSRERFSATVRAASIRLDSPEIEEDDADEATVAVSAEGRDPEATVTVAARSLKAEDVLGTPSAGAEGPDDEKTLIVSKPRPSGLTKARPRRRGLLRPAPVPIEVLDRAVQAPGPGAIATYASRQIQPPPTTTVIDTGIAASRQDAATIPSIKRRSASTAAVVLSSTVAAIIVAVGGLVLIGVFVFG